MQIHSVRSGETLYSIAREYGVSPVKLAEINGLKNPDRLAVGRELLVLFPRRTYTARRGDTLDALSKRFSVDKGEIFRSNPSLYGSEKIYPEELISLGYCELQRGALLLDGYLYPSCPKDRLSFFEPYLNSITVSSKVWERGKMRKTFSFSPSGRSVRNIRQRIYCPPPYEMDNFSSESATYFVTKAKEEGYYAITLAAGCAAKEKDFENFLRRLMQISKENGLSLYLEYANGSPDTLLKIPDGIIVSDSEDKEVIQSLAENVGAAKITLDISPFASLDGKPIPMGEALAMADAEGILLTQGENGEFLVGRVKKGELSVPSLKKIKARLDLIGELGLLGASLDIMRCPISIIMMLSSLYEINPSYFSGGM